MYAREGVAGVWLLDPDVRTLEVLRFERDRWVIVFTAADSAAVRAGPFADLQLALEDLWP